MARAPLSELDDWQLTDDDQDIRGCDVVDASGAVVGTVSELIADTEAERIVALLLTTGAEIPASSIDIGDDRTVYLRGDALPDATLSPRPGVRVYDATGVRRRLPPM